MKITPVQKAITSVVALSIVLGLLWNKYYDFLSQGQRPPPSSLKLNEIEKNGLPEFSIQSLTGEELNLKKFAGKVVILNFWASWCDPCIAEFPSLIQLIEKFKGNIVLLAISADYEEVDIQNFLKSFKVNSPFVHIAWDKNYEVASKFGTEKLPESYIIGKDGQLIRKISGVDDWSTPDAFAYFEHLLKE